MPDGSDSLENQIVNRFIDNIESSEDVSDQVSSAIADFSDEDDFGGRDRIADSVLEAVSEDED